MEHKNVSRLWLLVFNGYVIIFAIQTIVNKLKQTCFNNLKNIKITLIRNLTNAIHEMYTNITISTPEYEVYSFKPF